MYTYITCSSTLVYCLCIEAPKKIQRKSCLVALVGKSVRVKIAIWFSLQQTRTILKKSHF